MAKQKEKNVFLGKNKEILDIELLAIFEALDIVLKIANSRIPIMVCSNFQKVLKAIVFSFTFQENQCMQSQVYQKIEKLSQTEHFITFQQIFNHFRILRNEKVDIVVKNRVEKKGKLIER